MYHHLNNNFVLVRESKICMCVCMYCKLLLWTIKLYVQITKIVFSKISLFLFIFIFSYSSLFLLIAFTRDNTKLFSFWYQDHLYRLLHFSFLFFFSIVDDIFTEAFLLLVFVFTLEFAFFPPGDVVFT